MNQLYRTKYMREVVKKDDTVLKFIGNYSYMQYGEIEQKSKIITDWKALLKELNYKDEFDGYTDRKKRIWCNVGYTDKNWNRYETKLFKEDFKMAKSWLEFEIVNLKDIRMRELVNQLNAEEFILFLRNNEIKYVGGF